MPQGTSGEWTHVFVDIDRYGGTANEDYFRWAYTALTRSKQQIWHCNAPEFDYISKLKVEEIQRSAHLKVSVRSEGTDFRRLAFKSYVLYVRKQELRSRMTLLLTRTPPDIYE